VRVYPTSWQEVLNSYSHRLLRDLDHRQRGWQLNTGLQLAQVIRPGRPGPRMVRTSSLLIHQEGRSGLSLVRINNDEIRPYTPFGVDSEL